MAISPVALRRADGYVGSHYGHVARARHRRRARSSQWFLCAGGDVGRLLAAHSAAADGRDGQSLGAARALALAENPGKFLSSVQVGITLIGILSGAFGGATLGARLGAGARRSAVDRAAWRARRVLRRGLLHHGAVGDHRRTGAEARRACRIPKRIAARVARPLRDRGGGRRGRSSGCSSARPPLILAHAGHPRARRHERHRGGGEVRDRGRAPRPASSTQVEEEMIHGVLELADRSVASIMTPRPDVYWIDLDDDPETIARDVAECPYSRIVVARDGDISHPLGVVQKKDLVADLIAGKGIRIEAHLLEPTHVPETMPAMRMLQIFRTVPLHVAFVVDEYGDFLGLVTLTDIMSAVAGDLPEEHRQTPQELLQRDDGSWLVDGRAAIDEVKETLGLRHRDRTATFTPPPVSRSSGWRASRRKASISSSRAGGSRSSTWTATASTSSCSSRRRRRPRRRAIVRAAILREAARSARLLRMRAGASHTFRPLRSVASATRLDDLILRSRRRRRLEGLILSCQPALGRPAADETIYTLRVLASVRSICRSFLIRSRRRWRLEGLILRSDASATRLEGLILRGVASATRLEGWPRIQRAGHAPKRKL